MIWFLPVCKDGRVCTEVRAGPEIGPYTAAETKEPGQQPGETAKALTVPNSAR